MRFTKPTKMNLPKQARTIPIKAGGDENGKLFRCWNCGFPCNTDRDDSSGSTAGDNHTDYSELARGYVENGEEDRMMTLDGFDFYHTILETDADGPAKTIVHDHLTDVTKGCPMCGTTNYRG